MPIKRYNGTDWEVVAGAGVVGAPGTNGTNGTNGSSGAGVNKIINGDFGIWQRGTSFSGVGGYGVYNAADRFRISSIGNSSTVSQQAFTLGSAPVAGYEAQYFMRVATASSAMSYFDIGQAIEDVRTFAGQTVTISFWAKAGATGTTVIPQIIQGFGSGGSAQTTTSAASSIALTTSWTRYSATIAVPSIAGKTVGAGSWCGAYLSYNSGTINSITVDTWGWQVEAGSVATTFQTATGTIQGELAACQRYYWRLNTDTADFGAGVAASGTVNILSMNLPVTMRTKPVTLDTLSLQLFDLAGFVFRSGGTFALYLSTPNTAEIRYTHGSSVFTVNQTSLWSGSSSTSYIGLGAEL